MTIRIKPSKNNSPLYESEEYFKSFTKPVSTNTPTVKSIKTPNPSPLQFLYHDKEVENPLIYYYHYSRYPKNSFNAFKIIHSSQETPMKIISKLKFHILFIIII